MDDQHKTKVQLIEELVALRQKVVKLENACAAKINLAEHQQIIAEYQQSERRYRAIVEDQTELICRVSPTGTYNFVNEAYARYFGQTVASLIGHRLEPSPVFAADRERLAAYYASLGLDNPTGSIEHRVQLPNGEIRWQHWTDRALFDKQGQLIEYQSVGRDITKRKLASEHLQAREEHLRSILDNVADGLITIGEQGLIETFNPAAEKMFGYDAAEVRGQELGLLMPEPYRSQHAEYLANYLRTGQAKVIGIGRQVEGRRKDGTTFPLDLAVGEFQQGERRLFIGVVRDITDRRKAEVSLQEANAELRQTQALLRTLIDNIPAGILVRDIDGRYVVVNRQAAAWNGYTVEQVVGRFPGDVFPLEIRGVPKQITPGTEPSQREYVVPGPDKIRLVHEHRFPIFDDSGEFYGVCIFILDITERKQAEERLQKHEVELQRRNRELALLNRIIAASTAVHEPEEILEIACRELAMAFDLPQVTVTLLDDEQAGRVAVAEYQAVKGKPLLLKRVDSTKYDPIIQHILIHKAPMVIEPGQSDPGLAPIQELMAQHGSGSLLVVPLVMVGDVIGTLSFDAAEPRTFSNEEINLAWSVADQVAGALVRVQHSQERRMLSAALEQSVDCIIITDIHGMIIYVNPAFEKITGYMRTEAIGRNPHILKGGRQSPATYQELWDAIAAGVVWHGRLVNKTKSGKLYTVDAIVTPVRNKHGDIVNYVALERDMTKEMQLEEQLRQSQKMEAIGRLAGGVAHDFNNLLTIISGHTEFLLESYLDTHDVRIKDVAQIKRATERATLLTRQLLAFSRQQAPRLQPVNLNHVITSMVDMLRRLLGEQLSLLTDLAPNLGPILIDPGQLEQIIMNLAVNGRDAMPTGGQLLLKTTQRTLSVDEISRMFNLEAGSYIVLSVSDTGVGMDKDVQDHIFEPFYTTKAFGKGTGLGLAIVFGIVEQSRGYIEVESVLGQGTTFTIFLPQAEQVAAEVPPIMPKL